MDFRGYFCVYRKEIILISNYAENGLECLNGLIYSLTGIPCYYNRFDEDEKRFIDPLMIAEIFSSDFIQRGFRHFPRNIIPYNCGLIYIFRYEHGSLKYTDELESPKGSRETKSIATKKNSFHPSQNKIPNKHSKK